MHRLFVAVLTMVVVGSAAAQGRSGGPPIQSVGPTISVYTFGSSDASLSGGFDLDGVMPGIAFSSRGVVASASRGTGRSDVAGVPSSLVLTDFSLRLRSDPAFLTRSLGKGWTVAIPILLLSTYRKVDAEQGTVSIQIFDYSTVGIGSGLGISGSGRRWRAETRVTPAIGFATRGFGNSTGRFTTLEVDAGLAVGSLFGKFGLSVGYGWAIQNWHVGGLDAIVVSTAGKVDYDGSSHTFRLGLTW